MELDLHTGASEVFVGDYTEYAEERARRREHQWAEYRRQQERERRVKQEISDIKGTAMRREKSSQNDFYRRKAKKVARRAVVLERRLLREMHGEDRVEKPQMRRYRLKTELRPVSRGGDRMLNAERVRLTVDGRDLLTDALLSIGWGERVVIIGTNGSGKTTLLETLVGHRTPGGGTVQRSPSTNIGYLPQEDALRELDNRSDTPLSLIRATAPLSETEARRYLHRFLFAGDGAHTPNRRLELRRAPAPLVGDPRAGRSQPAGTR